MCHSLRKTFFGSVAVVNHVPLSLCKNCVATGDRFLPNKMCVLTSGETRQSVWFQGSFKNVNLSFRDVEGWFKWIPKYEKYTFTQTHWNKKNSNAFAPFAFESRFVILWWNTILKSSLYTERRRHKNRHAVPGRQSFHCVVCLRVITQGALAWLQQFIKILPLLIFIFCNLCWTSPHCHH